MHACISLAAAVSFAKDLRLEEKNDGTVNSGDMFRSVPCVEEGDAAGVILQRSCSTVSLSALYMRLQKASSHLLLPHCCGCFCINSPPHVSLDISNQRTNDGL